MTDNNIEIHVRSLFLQGLLLMDKLSLPKKFYRWDKLFSKYYNYLEKLDIDPLTLNLSFPQSFNKINKYIVGIDSLNHLKQIVSALEVNRSIISYPDIEVNDPDLINPSNW